MCHMLNWTLLKGMIVTFVTLTLFIIFSPVDYNGFLYHLKTSRFSCSLTSEPKLQPIHFIHLEKISHICGI